MFRTCGVLCVTSVVICLAIVACGGDSTNGIEDTGDTADVVVTDAWTWPAIAGMSSSHGDHASEHGDGDHDHDESPSSGAVTTGVIYMTVENLGSRLDRLVSASSPVAEAIEIHRSTMDNGIVRMRPVDSIEVDAGEVLSLESGGYHVMLVGLTRDLDPGDTFEVELQFERAGTISVVSEVRLP